MNSDELAGLKNQSIRRSVSKSARRNVRRRVESFTNAKIHLTVAFPFSQTPRDAKALLVDAGLVRRVLQWHFEVDGFMLFEIERGPSTHHRQRPHLHFVLDKDLEEEEVLNLLAEYLGWEADDRNGKLVHIIEVDDLKGLAKYFMKPGQKTFLGLYANLKRSFIRLHPRFRPTRPPTPKKLK